jgi:heme A synthase
MTDSSRRPLSAALRLLLFLSSCLALLVLVAGALKTSATIWAQLNPAYLPLAQSTVLTLGHQHAGTLLLVLLAVCAWFAWKSSDRIIWWLTGAALIAGLCEMLTVVIGPLHNATYLAAAHAMCGHTIFACLAAAAIIAITGSRHTEPTIAISGGFPLVSLAVWIPPLVLTQVAMGALYRHDLWGVVPHMAGAMAVAFLFVAEGVILLQKAPEHRLLSRAATWGITVVIVQISLGIADFLLRLLDFQDSLVWTVLSVAHVTVAAFVFTASICLAVSVRAYVREMRAGNS